MTDLEKAKYLEKKYTPKWKEWRKANKKTKETKVYHKYFWKWFKHIEGPKIKARRAGKSEEE